MGHRGNTVNTNDDYEQTGYPMGLWVMAEAQFYGVLQKISCLLWLRFEMKVGIGAENENGEPILDDFEIKNVERVWFFQMAQS